MEIYGVLSHRGLCGKAPIETSVVKPCGPLCTFVVKISLVSFVVTTENYLMYLLLRTIEAKLLRN